MTFIVLRVRQPLQGVRHKYLSLSCEPEDVWVERELKCFKFLRGCGRLCEVDGHDLRVSGPWGRQKYRSTEVRRRCPG